MNFIAPRHRGTVLISLLVAASLPVALSAATLQKKACALECDIGTGTPKLANPFPADTLSPQAPLILQPDTGFLPAVGLDPALPAERPLPEIFPTDSGPQTAPATGPHLDMDTLIPPTGLGILPGLE